MKKEKETGRAQFVGVSKNHHEIMNLINKHAKTDKTVLIIGETGTGKELIAADMHFGSLRENGPFVKINCAAITETLLESELFGYQEGAFTGAMKDGKRGKFELTHKGTIFLDEIGDMTLTTQAKILRVLQEKEVEQVGGTKTIKVDVRVIAATNKDLMREIKEKRFREDLYYRLNMAEIRVPPLRERREDVIAILDHYLAKERIDPKVKACIYSSDLPGNVRELMSLSKKEYYEIDRSIYKEFRDFLSKYPIDDLRKLIYLYEVYTLTAAGVSKDDIARIIHVRRNLLFNSKWQDDYGISVDEFVTRFPVEQKGLFYPDFAHKAGIIILSWGAFK